MGRDATIRLSDFLKGRFGDELRAVTHYDSDRIDNEYLRDDIPEAADQEEVEEIANFYRQANTDRKRMEKVVGSGKFNASLGFYENKVELHLPHSQRSGTVATLEATAMEELYSFVGDCLTVVGSQERE